MPRPSTSAIGVSERYRLALTDVPVRGVAGERLGRGTGSSLEFQDRRAYAAGDDVRHLDWRAFARTDQLYVRQYREEILPRVDLVVDASRSMGLHERKAQATVDLAAILALAARAEGLSLNVVRAGARPEPVEIERLTAAGLEFDGASALDRGMAELAPLLRTGALRIVLSDFLFPHEPRALLRALLARGGGLIVVQLLDRDERDPPLDAASRLVDCESRATHDLVIDRAAIERYRGRLKRLCDELETEARRLGARHASLTAEGELASLCRDRLVPAGILAPA